MGADTHGSAVAVEATRDRVREPTTDGVERWDVDCGSGHNGEVALEVTRNCTFGPTTI